VVDESDLILTEEQSVMATPIPALASPTLIQISFAGSAYSMPRKIIGHLIGLRPQKDFHRKFKTDPIVD
jgi:hypothetical protein